MIYPGLKRCSGYVTRRSTGDGYQHKKMDAKPVIGGFIILYRWKFFE